MGNGKNIFLKQAPEFVAIFGPDGFPLTSERMQREMDVYNEWRAQLGEELASKYLPSIYYFDSKYCSQLTIHIQHFISTNKNSIVAVRGLHGSDYGILGWS